MIEVTDEMNYFKYMNGIKLLAVEENKLESLRQKESSAKTKKWNLEFKHVQWL